MASSPSARTVIAFAGRRIDPPLSNPPRFPPENEELVRGRVRHSLTAVGPATLVASAACGADLLALEVADELSMTLVVVLPWERDRFRERSVVDRGGNWGKRFDRIIDKVAKSGDLRVLNVRDDDDKAYEVTTTAILDVADELARGGSGGQSVKAVAVWDRQSRGPGDLTERFVKEARARHIDVLEIPTR